MPLRLFILGCWIVFAVYWAIAATSTKRTAARQSWAERSWYLLLLAVALALLFGAFPVDPIKRRIVPPYPALQLLAAALCAGGLLFGIWARRTIGTNWSSVVTLKQDHEFVTNGPYRYVRHPIYTAILTMFLGTAVATGQLGGFLGLALCSLSMWIKLRQEEKLMMRHFPQQYPAYRARVKALVPFVL